MSSHFNCPISQQIMTDPVIIEDGHSYQRDQIITWFYNHNTSPITGLTLSSLNVIPNISLRNQISEAFPNLIMLPHQLSSNNNSNNLNNSNNSNNLNTNNTNNNLINMDIYVFQPEPEEDNRNPIYPYDPYGFPYIIRNNNLWSRLGLEIDSREDLNNYIPITPFRLSNFTPRLHSEDISDITNLIIDLTNFSRTIIDGFIEDNLQRENLTNRLINDIIYPRIYSTYDTHNSV